MLLSHDDVVKAWKNFLRATSDKIVFELLIRELNRAFSEHYHRVKYDSEPLTYMESLPNIVYGFTYDIILKDDERFKKQKGGDVQIEILAKMANINNHEKTTMDAIDFMHKYCNPDCRAILEKVTIEFL